MVLLTPLVVSTPPLPTTYFPFIVGKALYARTMTEIALGIWVVLTLRYPRHRPPTSPLLVIFAAYVVITLLSSVFGVSPQRSIWSTYERMQGFVDITHWFAFILVMTSVFRTWADWRMLLTANVSISVFMALLGLGEQSGIWTLTPAITQVRLIITLGNPTYVGGYMLVNALIASGFLGYSLLNRSTTPPSQARRKRRRRANGRDLRRWRVSTEAVWRLFWVAAIVLNVSVLYLSGTRGALIGLGGGVLALTTGYILWGSLRYLRRLSMALVLSLAGLILVLGLVRNTSAFASIAGSNTMLSRIALLGPNDASLRGHINTWVIGLQAFLDRPLLGWGPENFTIAHDRYLTAEIVAQAVVSFDQAHNKPIEELTTKGAVGLAGYMAIWLYMLWVIAQRVRRQEPQDQIFTLFLGGALAGYFVQNLFLFDTPGTVPQFYLLVGYAIYLDSTPSGIALQASESQRTGQESRDRTARASVFVRSSAAYAGASVVAGAVVIMAVIVFNASPYLASRAIIDALNPFLPWEQRFDHFERSFTISPQLANYPRVELFTRLANAWDDLTDEEVSRALSIVEREGAAGTAAEPEEWRLQLYLGRVYQIARSWNPEYLGRARRLVERSGELAPERIEVVQMQVIQNMLEGNHDVAMETIEAYLERNPKGSRHLEGLRRQIIQALEQ